VHDVRVPDKKQTSAARMAAPDAPDVRTTWQEVADRGLDADLRQNARQIVDESCFLAGDAGVPYCRLQCCDRITRTGWAIREQVLGLCE
jgi:hypothetical protein